MKKFLLILLVPICTHAEPGPVTQYLFDEPASLFDIGMLRLRQSTIYWEEQVSSNYHHHAKTQKSGGNVNIGYLKDKDRFEVSLSIMDISSDKKAMEKGCFAALGSLRIYITKSLPGAFLHWGKSTAPPFPQYTESLIEMFDFTCNVYANDTTKVRFRSKYSGRAVNMAIETESIYKQG